MRCLIFGVGISDDDEEEPHQGRVPALVKEGKATTLEKVQGARRAFLDKNGALNMKKLATRLKTSRPFNRTSNSYHGGEHKLSPQNFPPFSLITGVEKGRSKRPIL
jgi:hypothetical protein